MSVNPSMVGVKTISAPPAATPALAAFVDAPDYPCLGAKAAFARQSVQLIEAGNMEDAQHDEAIAAALQRFAVEAPADAVFISAVVLFAPGRTLTEAAFERALWQRLQALHALDRRQFGWDPQVSSDPASAHFSMSLGGKAFYVVGLHPGASRPARRYRQPALVFNLHSQFEQLRADGRYQKLREAIIERDLAHAGSVNPMLAGHGKGPAAPQYSGRRVEADWVCPFHAQAPGARG